VWCIPRPQSPATYRTATVDVLQASGGLKRVPQPIRLGLTGWCERMYSSLRLVVAAPPGRRETSAESSRPLVADLIVDLAVDGGRHHAIGFALALRISLVREAPLQGRD